MTVLGQGEAVFELPACSACYRVVCVCGQRFLCGQTKSGYKTWSVAYETTPLAPSLQIKLTDVMPVPRWRPCVPPQR